MSEDFCEGRGAGIGAFRGFRAAQPFEDCKYLLIGGARKCLEINERVVIESAVPTIEDACDAGPSAYDEPTWAVSIDLPKTKPIHGIMFIFRVLSKMQRDKLRAGIGNTDPCSDPKKREAFAVELQNIKTQIASGQIDEGTRANIKAVEEFAKVGILVE